MLEAFNDDLTIVSFSEQTPPPPERRAASRHLSILRTAVMRTDRSEELCLVRNISSGGLMAQIFCELGVGDTVELEFKSGKTVSGLVVWCRDDLVGVEFSQLVELAAILSSQFECTFLPLEQRAPRVDVNVPARIQTGETSRRVVLHNISQGGAGLGLDAPPRIGTSLIFDAPGLSPLAGTVRWQRDNRIGIAFNRQIPFPDVARWVAASHRATIDRDEVVSLQGTDCK